MARYGDYETVEELAHSARVVVWRARRAGTAGGEQFALKVFRASEWGEPATEAAAQNAFVAAAEIQASVARTRPRHWVPIIARGTAGEEAYWVAPLYPRSVERLIEGRVNLNSHDLHTIVVAVVRGLADLHFEHRRPHGNLKPTNILIDGSGVLRGAPITLSDPLAPGEFDEAAARVADQHALGRIIVLLVRRRTGDAKGVIGWPIEPGPEWKRLGRSGEGWRSICNELLKPESASGRLDFDGLERALVGLDRGPGPRWMLLAAASTPVIVLLASGAYLRIAPYDSLPQFAQGWAERLGNTPPDRERVPEEWALLCRAYFEWVGPLMARLEDPAGSGVLTRNAYFREQVMAPLMEVKARNDTLDPRRFEGVSAAGGNLMAMADEPPAAAKKGTVVRRTLEAWRAVEAAAKAFAEWPERAALQRAATRFEAAGWTGPASELRTASAPDTGSRIDPGVAIDIIRLVPAAARADTLLAELERKHNALGDDVDGVLRGLRRFQLDQGRLADTSAALVRALAEANQDIERLSALIRDSARADYPRFRRESFAETFSGPVTAEVLARWEQEFAEYTVVAPSEDPRSAADWAPVAARIDQALAAYAEEERSQPDERAAGNRLRASVAAVKERAVQLQSRRVLRKDRAAAAREVAALQADYEQLDGIVQAALAQIRPDATGWLARVRAATFGPIDAPLQRSWSVRRERMLAGADAAALNRNVAAFRTLRERVRQLEAAFALLAGERGLAALARPDFAGAPEALVASLNTAANTADNVAAEELVALLPEADLGASAASVALESPRWAAARRRHAETLAELTELGRGLAALDADLNRDAGDGGTLASSFATLRARSSFGAVSFAASVQALERDFAELERIRTETSGDTLASALRSPRLALALAAWRRLLALPGWAVSANVERMTEIVLAWPARLTREVREEAVRAALRDEIRTAAAAWWRRAFARAQDDAAIGSLLAARENFGVAEESLGPAERFNVQLFRLKAVDWRALSTDDLVRQRDEAVNRMRLTLGLAADAETSTWLSSLAALQLLEAPGTVTDLRKLGPGRVGWEGEVGEGGRSVTYRRRWANREQQITFRLVESDNVVPFFLATSEMATGLFLDLLTQPGVLTRMVPWLQDAAGEDGEQRLGVQVWRLDLQRGARLNDRWTGVPLPTWPKSLYPDDVPAPGAPTRNHPLQYLPPAAALYLATEVLGCRLPAPAEWQALATRQRAEAAAANLRDSTWLRTHNYLLGAGVLADSPLLGDVFWPRSAGIPKTGRDAQATASGSDNIVWFAEVGAAPDPEGFSHLFGNVAEYLYDEDSRRFSVAGASALSPPEVEPERIYPVEAAFATGGYSDVGFRLAFNAPGTLAERNRLRLMIRNKPYLRPAS